MSVSKKIGIAVSAHSVRIYLSAQTVQHLGGPGTRIRFYSKRIAEGHWTVSIREDRQTSYKIAQHGSKDHPFKIEISTPPYPLDRWPHTPPIKPLYIPITYDEHPKRQITFEVRADELSGRVDAKDLKSALKPLANEMKQVLDKPFISTQPQPQATLIRPQPQPPQDAPWVKIVPESEITKAIIRESDIPPAHIRLNDVLRILNSLLTVDLNDIELYVEQIDETGGVVKSIPLPVPSQMRIKGRRIREETFG